MLDPPSQRNNQPPESRPDPNDSTDQTGSTAPNRTQEPLNTTSESLPGGLGAESAASSTSSTSASAPHDGPVNNPLNVASRFFRAFERMQNGLGVALAFAFQHLPTETPTSDGNGGAQTGSAPAGNAPASNFEQAFPSADLLDLIISQSLAAHQRGIRRMQAREAGETQGAQGPETNQGESTNTSGPFQQLSSANILAGLFGLDPSSSSTNVPGTGSDPSGTPATPGASTTTPGSAAAAPATGATSATGATTAGTSAAAATSNLSALGDEIGAIIITINYRFNNDDIQNPNRNGSLVISVPNNSNNRHPEAIEAYLHLATRLAYEDIFRNFKTGITEEKFESFEVVPVDDLTDRICSICFEPYDGLEPLEKMADSIALKRRKLSPDDHSVSLSESEERVDRPERSGTLGGNSTSSTVTSSTSNSDSWTNTSASDPNRSTESNNSSQTSGPAYLCDQDKEFSHEAIKFPCGHIFGKSCLAHWLKTATTCPLCRFNVNPTAAEGSGRDMPEAPQPGAVPDFLHLFPDWMRPPPVDQQAEQQSQEEATSGNLLSALETSAPTSSSAASPPNLSRTSTSSSVPSSSFEDTRSETSSGSSRGAHALGFLRRSTQSIFRRARRPDAPPTPLMRPGTEQHVPASLNSQGLDSSDGANTGFEARRFIARNPSFVPVIEGISNILRSPRLRPGNANGENSIFASGMSSRRTADGVETTTTDGMPLRNASAESVFIFSPNYFTTRHSQEEIPTTNSANENNSNGGETNNSASTNDRHNSTLNNNGESS